MLNAIEILSLFLKKCEVGSINPILYTGTSHFIVLYCVLQILHFFFFLNEGLWQSCTVRGWLALF